jgi:hypothetical protein
LAWPIGGGGEITLKKTLGNVSQSFLSEKKNLGGGKRNYRSKYHWAINDLRAQDELKEKPKPCDTKTENKKRKEIMGYFWNKH